MFALRNSLALFALLCPGLAFTTRAAVTPHVLRTVSPDKTRDAGLEEAIRRELGSDGFSYAYNRVSLSSRSEAEFLVYLRGADYCGSGGCTSLVFATRNGQFRLISRLTLVRTPIIVSSHRTNGWNDLIVFVAGGGIQQGFYSVLPFNGREYPENPTIKPAIPPRQTVTGIAYLSGADSPGSDIVVSPPK
jgi:hypothetical protein